MLHELRQAIAESRRSFSHGFAWLAWKATVPGRAATTQIAAAAEKKMLLGMSGALATHPTVD